MVYANHNNRVVLPLSGGGKVAIPLVTPSVGSLGVVLPLQGGGKVATRLYTPAVGDKVVVMQLQGGSKVAIPIDYAEDDEFVTLRVRVNFGDGGTHELESTVVDDGEWIEITQFYGIPEGINPFFFQYIEFYSQYNTKTATVQSVGASKDFGNPLKIEQVLTYYVKFSMGHLYIDKIQFRNYDTSEIYDLNGNGGFETDPTNWNIVGYAEISTSEAYEGTHSLKML